MFSLLMEELARDRDRARLTEANVRRLVSSGRAAAAVRQSPRRETPLVGTLRRAAGRRFIEFGAWLAGTTGVAYVGQRHVIQPAGRCAHCLW